MQGGQWRQAAVPAAAAAAATEPPQQPPADDSEEWAELCDPDSMQQLLDGTTRLLKLSTTSPSSSSMRITSSSCSCTSRQVQQTVCFACQLDRLYHTVLYCHANLAVQRSMSVMTRSTWQLMLHTRVHHTGRHHVACCQLQQATIGRASLR